MKVIALIVLYVAVVWFITRFLEVCTWEEDHDA